MYKLLVFQDSQFAAIEKELNSMDGYKIAFIWTSSGRIGILLEKEIEKRGRPKKEVED